MDLSGLPTELEQFVQHELQSGRYDSAEAVVSAALRLLQEHKTQGGNGHPSSNSRPAAPYRSALEVRQALSEALTAGKHHLARQLALDGAQQYPTDTQLQKYAQILAPPVSKSVASTPESRAALKANNAWMKSNWQDHRGNWVAVQGGLLLHSSPSFEEVTQQVGDVQGRNILLTKIN
jgi:putative addiction module CopG family antidote